MSWGWLHFIDGGWFDITTFAVALALATFKCFRHKHPFISQATGINILHGIAIFPLSMLAISVVSNEIFDAVKNSNRLILTVAGAVALFSILEDEFASGTEKKL